jgi:hypothetical protein
MKKKRLLTDRSGELQDKMLAEQADALAREIDREVLWSMLKEIGWIRVELSSQTDKSQSEEIVNWLRTNVHHPYEKFRESFIFENKKDATTFILRWL